MDAVFSGFWDAFGDVADATFITDVTYDLCAMEKLLLQNHGFIWSGGLSGSSECVMERLSRMRGLFTPFIEPSFADPALSHLGSISHSVLINV